MSIYTNLLASTDGKHWGKELERLRSGGFDYSAGVPEYNPMEGFVEYVSSKEIVHSRILADLLDPQGRHRQGDCFLKSFVSMFCPCRFTTRPTDKVKVHTEYYLTETGRRIDILILWADKSQAIIIENKINGAAYQPHQLEDYRKCIKGKGYKDVYVICIHKSKGLNDENPAADKILYPADMAECLEEASSSLPSSLQAYVTLLKNMAKNTIMMQNAQKLLTLESKSLEEVHALAEAYNYIPQAKSELIKDALKKEYSEEEFTTLEFSLKQDCYLQIWRGTDYQRNGCWITVCVWRDSYGLFLTTYDKEERAKACIASARYEKYGNTEDGYLWYVNPDKHFFQNSELKEVVEGVKCLLDDVLSK